MEIGSAVQVSITRPLEWRNAFLQDSKPAGSADANFWLENFYAAGPVIQPGETVIRTRLQMNLTFGWQSVALEGGDIEHPWYEAQQNIVGLYANPGRELADGSEDPSEDVSDGFWIQNDALTLHQVAYNTNYLGQTMAETVWKCDSGTNESFGKRGPYTAEFGTVFLAWNFNNTGNYWNSDDTEFLGWMGGQARWAVLVQKAS